MIKPIYQISIQVKNSKVKVANFHIYHKLKCINYILEQPNLVDFLFVSIVDILWNCATSNAWCWF